MLVPDPRSQARSESGFFVHLVAFAVGAALAVAVGLTAGAMAWTAAAMAAWALVLVSHGNAVFAHVLTAEWVDHRAAVLAGAAVTVFTPIEFGPATRPATPAPEPAVAAAPRTAPPRPPAPGRGHSAPRPPAVQALLGDDFVEVGDTPDLLGLVGAEWTATPDLGALDLFDLVDDDHLAGLGGPLAGAWPAAPSPRDAAFTDAAPVARDTFADVEIHLTRLDTPSLDGPFALA